MRDEVSLVAMRDALQRTWPLFVCARELPSGHAFVARYAEAFDERESVEAMAAALALVGEVADELMSPKGVPRELEQLATSLARGCATVVTALRSLPELLDADPQRGARAVRERLGPAGAATKLNPARDLAEALQRRCAEASARLQPALGAIAGSQLVHTATRELAPARTELLADYRAKARGLDNLAFAVLPALGELTRQLAELVTRITALRSRLIRLCATASEAQLASEDWLRRALELPELTARWAELGAQAEAFVASGCD